MKEPRGGGHRCERGYKTCTLNKPGVADQCVLVWSMDPQFALLAPENNGRLPEV